MNRWRPQSAGSRGAAATASNGTSAVQAQGSLCGGMELAPGGRSGSIGRAGPSFAPCYGTMMWPVTYPQLVGERPGGLGTAKRRPRSAGATLTRSGTIGSGSSTRFIRELKPAATPAGRRASPDSAGPELAGAAGTTRLSVRAREPRPEDDDRATDRFVLCRRHRLIRVRAASSCHTDVWPWFFCSLQFLTTCTDMLVLQAPIQVDRPQLRHDERSVRDVDGELHRADQAHRRRGRRVAEG